MVLEALGTAHGYVAMSANRGHANDAAASRPNVNTERAHEHETNRTPAADRRLLALLSAQYSCILLCTSASNGFCLHCLQAEVFGKHLTRLSSLRLPGCGLTDFDLLGLRPLTGLQLLDIGDATEVTRMLGYSIATRVRET